MQKALLLVQDVETYLMLKRLEKLKSSVQSYVANNNNFKPENTLTADDWKLVRYHTVYPCHKFRCKIKFINIKGKMHYFYLPPLYDD